MLVVRSTTLNDAARSNDPYQPLKKKERKDAKAIQQILRKTAAILVLGTAGKP
jgi:hypothetical protein